MNTQQLEILKLIVSGKTNKHISKDLGIAYWRLTKLCSAIYWELKTEGRLDTRYKYQAGLLPASVMKALEVKPTVDVGEMLLPRGAG